MVTNEYRKRLSNPSARIQLHRYIPEEMYCPVVNATKNGINIKKYDIVEKNWKEFKSFPLNSRGDSFGFLFSNGELFVMGGKHKTAYARIVSVNNC